MPSSINGAIGDLAISALDTTLLKSEWTHAAHFALALWCIRHRPDLTAPDAFRGIIVRLYEAHGTLNIDSEGYHHTITVAPLKTAASMHAEHEGKPLRVVRHQLLASRFGSSGWIMEHWTREALFTPAARRGWGEPDGAPLDF